MLKIERELAAEGFDVICGIDEAGRGPLAGPVYAAAVTMPQPVLIPGLRDSKKLSPGKRDKLFDEIIKAGAVFGTGFATHTEIDKINILKATFLAMNRAVEILNGKLTANGGNTVQICLIDGNQKTGIEYHGRCIAGGDDKSQLIAAASVIAKVTRDRYMCAMALDYPQYGFEKHKGYGTALHYRMLEEYGPCPIHRKTFLKGVQNAG